MFFIIIQINSLGGHQGRREDLYRAKGQTNEETRIARKKEDTKQDNTDSLACRSKQHPDTKGHRCNSRNT